MSNARKLFLCALLIVLAVLLFFGFKKFIVAQNESGVYAGYNLFAPLKSTDTYLMDNDGNTVFTWVSEYNPGNSVYLLESGNILHTGNTRSSNFDVGGQGGIVQEIKPDNTVVWEFEYSTSQVRQHHDVAYLLNGNVLMIAWERKSKEEILQAGRNPALITEGGLWPDHIIEVQPNKESGNAAIVWEWHAWDHLVQNYDETKDNYGVVADHPELIDLNFPATGPTAQSADWMHTNSIDYHEGFDQILLTIHNFGEIWVIDHSTTTAEAAGHSGGKSGKGGDLLYRWGNPQTYGAGSAADQKFFGQHDATWIETPLPGEGDILVFNNGQGRTGRNYSSVDEITPPVNDAGVYSYTTGSAYEPESQNWIYTAKTPADFYAMNISGAQRLPNGNTLICDGPDGYFFEVTSDKETVWNYSHGGPIFRVYRYSTDYPGVSALKEIPPLRSE